jgi:hypothetical protein
LEGLPQIIDIKYQIIPDAIQRVEYLESLDNGIDELSKLMVNGNPYRFNSNVFTLLHQLLRINNFASESISSSKLEFTINILKKIAANKKQAVIFVMDEKDASDNISRALHQNGIRFTSFYNGKGPEELYENTKKFKEDKGITVFLAGIKSIKGKLKLPFTDYIIYFDKWWNPASWWQLESSVFSLNPLGKTKSRTVRISLFSTNSIDTIIQNEITQRGFNSELLFEAINPQLLNEVLSNREWMKILLIHAEQFGIEVERDLENERDEQIILSHSLATIKERLISQSKDELLNLVKRFIYQLNYSDVKIRVVDNNNEFELEAFNQRKTYYNQIFSVVLFAECQDEDALYTKIKTKILNNLGLKSIIFQLYQSNKELRFEDIDNIVVINLDMLTKYIYYLKIH